MVALALLAYLFKRTHPALVLQAVKSAGPWTVPVLAILIFPIYMADSLAMWRIFGWFVTRLSLREVLVVRGATYILAMINYALGQGTIVYFVNRSRGVPVMRGAAAVLLVMGTNLLLLLFLATAGVAMAPHVPPALPTVLMVAWAGLAVYAVVVAVKPRWLASRPLFDVLLAAGVGGHLKAVAVRIPHLLCLLIFTYVSLRAFGVRVPVVQAIAGLPLVYFVAVLPIAPAGLGTMQWTLVYLFSPYGPEAAIVASSLASQGIAVVVQSLIGLICLRNQMARDLPARAGSQAA
jgi:hypothetical protein